jgi:type II secretory pathway pseudopilin PulG
MPGASRFRRRSRSHSEQGYILLTLMFLATLVVLSLVALAPQLTQQIKRDHEEELIHRGVQYSRAIQHFYKKTGRYPVRLEELDNFNNVRFLRKHYKDPITGEDFKILHFGEVRTMFGGGVAGIPGAVAVSNMGNVPGAVNPQAAMISQGGLNQVTPLTQNQMNATAQAQAMMQVPQQGMASQPGDNSTDSTSVSPSPSPEQSNGSSNDQGAAAGEGKSNNGPLAVSAFGTPGQQFGGGPIVGVASTSKKKSIREFNKKNHYKDWQFIYDPSSDRGGLLNTPAQPNLNASMNNSGQVNNQAGPGQGQGFGPQQPGGFGPQPGGFGQQPNGFGQQGMPIPNQPPDQMQPEQQ